MVFGPGDGLVFVYWIAGLKSRAEESDFFFFYQSELLVSGLVGWMDMDGGTRLGRRNAGCLCFFDVCGGSSWRGSEMVYRGR